MGSAFLELKSKGNLPTIKGVALNLLQEAANPSASIESIAKTLMPDPALTAKLLKVANSSLYPGARPIASVADAVTKLGMHTVKQVALGFSLVQDYKSGQCDLFDYDEFWRKSIGTGCAARQFCLRMRTGSPEEMFTLGLLWEVGKLSLACAYPEAYANILGQGAARDGKELCRQERLAFSMDSYELGSHLLREWQMPEPFCQALSEMSARFGGQAGESRGEARPCALADLMQQCAGLCSLFFSRLGGSQGEEEAAGLALAEENLGKLAANCFRSRQDPALCRGMAEQSESEAKAWLSDLGIGLRGWKAAGKSPPERIGIGPQAKLAEGLLDAQAEWEPLRVLAGSSDSGSLKAIMSACEMRHAQAKALKSKKDLARDAIGELPGMLIADWDEEVAGQMEAFRKTKAGQDCYCLALLPAGAPAELALGSCADDCLQKPFSAGQLASRIALAERFRDARRRFEAELASVRQYALQLETDNAKLRRNTFFDMLTGLANKTLLADRACRSLRGGGAGKTAALACLSVDNLKSINESLGHGGGDGVLLEAAEALRAEAQAAGETASRIDGNEFCALLFSDSREALRERISGLLGKICAVKRLGNMEVPVNASAGVCFGDQIDLRDASDGKAAFEAMLGRAQLALREARSARRGALKEFDESMMAQSKRRYGIETALLNALKGSEFEVYYQPRVDLATGKVAGAEALLRWTSRELGRISPEHFIPVAEECGLMDPIGDFVLKAALEQAKPWMERHKGFHMAINLSAKQFESRKLAQSLSSALAQLNVNPERVELEITESCAMGDVQLARKTLGDLKKIGVCVSIDDFGSGYSSLGYLKKLPFDMIKIDKSFVLQALADRDDKAICEMIASLAKSLGKSLVVEGVESLALAKFAKSLGAELAQGFYFSAPVPACEFTKLLDAAWDLG